MRFFLPSVLLILCSFQAVAQFGPSGSSPYKRTTGPYAVLGGLGLTLSVGATLGQQQVAPLTAAERSLLNMDDVLALDRATMGGWRPGVAKVSDAFLIGSVLLPLPLLLAKQPRADIGPLYLMGQETLLFTYGLTTLVKWLVRRPRPFNYLGVSPNLPGLFEAQQKRDARFSFFSGHTSTVSSMSFFTAQAFSDYFPGEINRRNRVLVWAGAAVIPAAVGWMRVRAGKHYPTDVIVGYLCGAAIGMLVPRLHKRW